MNDKLTIPCESCGDEFEPVILEALGVNRVSSTLCYKCRKDKREELEKIEQAKANNETVKRKERWLKVSGIPIRFRGVSFETFIDRGFNTKKIKDVCLDYVMSFPLVSGGDYKSLVIASPGSWGVGKTHLVCSIGKKVIERWIRTSQESPILYLTEPTLFRRLRATFNREYDKETELDVFNHLIEVPLLIVDDIGKEEVSDARFVQRVWFSVINGRYDNMLPVVLTANLTADEMANHLGGSRNNEAAFDRLLEMTGGVFWELNGTSKRQENNE